MYIRSVKQKSVLMEKAKQLFGTTDFFLAAGFLLPDGELLDFGTKNGDYRIKPYDEIAKIFDKKIEKPSLAFTKLGAIKIVDFGFELVIAPTFEQKVRLNQLLAEYRDQYGQAHGTILNGEGKRVCTEEYNNRIYRVEFWNRFNEGLDQRGLL